MKTYAKRGEGITQTIALWVVYMTTCRQFLCLLAASPFSVHPEVWVVFCNQIVIFCLYTLYREKEIQSEIIKLNLYYVQTKKGLRSVVAPPSLSEASCLKVAYPLWELWPISDDNHCPGQKCRDNGCHGKPAETFCIWENTTFRYCVTPYSYYVLNHELCFPYITLYLISAYSLRNCEAHLKRVLEVAWYGNITTHSLHTLDSAQLDGTFHHGLFLKERDLYFTCAIHSVDIIQIIAGSQAS